MANRTLTRADDNPGEILEDGELHKVGMWEEVVIERSSAGAPGLIFIITRYEGDQMYDQMCVSVPDGAAFLAPVNDWLRGNDPEAWVVHSIDEGDFRFATEADCWGGYRANFEPRPGYNQNREDYS
ncbi:hypothetical protein ACI7YT_12445 [Microbacterium sp. M]|uniref:hypothetical protein n=1 Tax=Microbacterium sp. M TaxID=3377125 RepID=UPI00386D236A